MAGYLTVTTALTSLITISHVYGQSPASVVNSISLYGRVEKIIMNRLKRMGKFEITSY